MRKKALITIGIMIFILNQVGVNYLIYKNKSGQEISKVKLKDQKMKNDAFAIMLEQNDGTYKTTNSTSFNQEGYIFNSEKSGCIDANGNKIENALSYNKTTKAIFVSTSNTAYCYVYFNIKLTAVAELITLASEKEAVYDNDDNLRYIGKNPNNYIYFNCVDYNNPTADTCEKWRIIGAFNNVKTGTGETKTLYKIIRSESLGSFSWDDKNGVGSSPTTWGSNDWTDSQLMLMLNGVSLGNYPSGYTVNGDYLLDKNRIRIMNISGSYYAGSSKTYLPAATTTSGYSSTETVDFSSKGLKNDTTRDMIENVVWNLGGAKMDTFNSVPVDFYSYERGTNVSSGHPTEWTGKIGLMYPSDYGYATDSYLPNDTDGKSCFEIDLDQWESYNECYENDWLFINDYEQWTLTPHLYEYELFFLSNSGSVGIKPGAYPSTVRPTVYLTSSIGINGGEGSEKSPYTLKVNN